MIGWIILALFVVLILVVLIRTLMFTPKEENEVKSQKIEVDTEKAAVEMSQMVRCKTVSHADESLDDLNEFDKFEQLLPKLFPKVYETCTYEKIGPRALTLHWKGKSSEKPIIFMAHYDVVPADEKEWARSAFDGAIENGIIYGRGTLDTKGTLLSVLHAAEMRIIEGLIPQNDIWFCFGGNEETMGYGAPTIVDELEKRGIKPSMVLDEGGAIVEGAFPGVEVPSALVGIAEKGSWNLQMEAFADGGHSSAPPAKSPVDKLSLAVCKIHDHPFKFKITEPAAELFDNISRRSSFLYRMIFSNLWLFKPALNILCKKQGGELNALCRTTIAFTMSEGSKGINVLPSSAKMIMNVRLLEGDTQKSALERFKRIVNDDSIKFTSLGGSDPSKTSPIDTSEYAAISRAIRETYDGVLVSPYLMIACSDSRHYERICPNVYRFSGMPLSTKEREMIHGKNEQIPASKLGTTIEFYYRLMGIVG